MQPAPTVSFIVAMAENRVIGSSGAIPWHIPDDLRRFRQLTMGHALIVGRKTYESIGHPLEGRRMIVLTRNRSYRPDGVTVAESLQEALSVAGDDPEVFIGGGGEVFLEAFPIVTRIHFTLVHRRYQGDTFFPPVPVDFVETGREDVPGDPPFSFVELARRP